MGARSPFRGVPVTLPSGLGTNSRGALFVPQRSRFALAEDCAIGRTGPPHPDQRLFGELLSNVGDGQDQAAVA